MNQHDIDAMGLAGLPAVEVGKDTILLTDMEGSTPDGHAESSAERTLRQLGYTDCGGEFWKPPLGKAAQPEQQAEPVPDTLGHVGFQEWWDAIADDYEVNDFKKMRRAWNAAVKYEATPQKQAEPVARRKPFDILAITTAYEQGVGKGHQAHKRSVEIENPYTPGECQQAWALGYDEGKEQASPKVPHNIKDCT